MLIQFSLEVHKNNNCVKAINWYCQISVEQILKLIYEHQKKKTGILMEMLTQP